jgi:hypothetical protein
MVFGKGHGKYAIKEEVLIGDWRMRHKEELHCLYSSLISLGRLDKQHEMEETKP